MLSKAVDKNRIFTVKQACSRYTEQACFWCFLLFEELTKTYINMQHHSLLKASIGLSSLAFLAGAQPKITLTAAEKPTPS